MPHLHLLEEIVERIFNYLPSNGDRNSASLVSKLWYKVDAYTRHRVIISNCYALPPRRLIARFPNLRSLTLKGKPRLSDPNSIPRNWGGFFHPWIVALAQHYPWLEELRLKRMVVSDESLFVISNSFPNFKSLVLISCDGFSTNGIAAIASNCKLLEQLELRRSKLITGSGQWLNCFPEPNTSLVSLDFSCLAGSVDVEDLEKLVARSPNLKILRLNKSVQIDTLQKLLTKVPGLVDLECAARDVNGYVQDYDIVTEAFQNIKSIRSFSISLQFHRVPLHVFHPICCNLSFLNLRYATGYRGSELVMLVRSCSRLRRLWIMDCIGDKGLEGLVSTLKYLEELRVYPTISQVGAAAGVTEEGLLAISVGCSKLHSLTFFCSSMTNAALKSLAINCPNLICFKLCIATPKQPDHLTLQPLDDGFGAILHNCKGIQKLSLSGLLTDQVFLYIGMYAERLEELSISGAGESDAGLLYVFNGCRNIKKLEIRNCPFGDTTLLNDVLKHETLRSVWISSGEVTLRGCKTIAQKMQSLNVEIMKKKVELENYPSDDMKVEKLYMYRTLAGSRVDAPDCVTSL